MKIHVSLGNNIFDVDEISELTPSFENVFRAWINAQQEGSAAEALDKATARLQDANAAEEQVVRDHTSKETV